MNIYTRRRGTQEAAGSKSGGGGQSERRAQSVQQERNGALLSSLDVYTVLSASRWCSLQLYRLRLPHMSINESLEIGAIECSALFLEIIVAARCENPSAEAEELATEATSAGHFYSRLLPIRNVRIKDFFTSNRILFPSSN